MSPISSEVSCASDFSCNKLFFFGFERLLHLIIHKGVVSFSTSFLIIDDKELRMQKWCGYILIVGQQTLYLSLEWTVTVYFGVKNFLAPL